MNVRVENMLSPRTGKPIANQFLITTDNATYFQSYNTVIAVKSGHNIILDRDSWDYSVTTGKYRNQFLGETKKITQAKIDSGVYQLANLN